uniref:RIMS-binding protein 2 n=1 Tax=Lepeophtheirus salmonis TaxID=72036 RepID=A0A0K2TTB7_LEPSM
MELEVKPKSKSLRPGVRTLEKKNKQLSNATKELEEKVKNLQQKTSQTTTRSSRSLPKLQSRSQSTPNRLRELPTTPMVAQRTRRASSTVTSRIREREAEFTKQVQDRDEQIARLKERLKILSKKLGDYSAGRILTNKEKNVKEEGVELQNIIKQVTKERLQLERHLQMANDSLQRNNGVDVQRYIELETRNNQLKQQLNSLDGLQQEHKLVELQFKEKEEACKQLMSSLKHKSALCHDLEAQLARVIEQNNKLALANCDLQKRVVQLQDVSEECHELKSTLVKVESEYFSAKSEVVNLSGKVRNLENVLEEMHKAAENRREIERQHKEALENLKRKREEEVEVNASVKQTELIEQLQNKIRELEKEKRLSNCKQIDLAKEMEAIKKFSFLDDEDNDNSFSSPSAEPNLEIDAIMAKLEQDNKFLAELEEQRAAASNKGQHSPPNNRAPSAITDSGFLSQSSLVNGEASSSPNQSHNGNLHKLPKVSGIDKIKLLNGDGIKSFDKTEGTVEIPGKGSCFVYVSRYSYDPFQHSPNDCPEAELLVNAGDYILVWGDIDEDGFFDGELLDGRRGLVPSNFVEKLEGEDLVDFHQQVILGLGDCDDSVCTSVPQDLDFISSSDENDERTPYFTRSSLIKRINSLPQYASCTDLELTEDDEEFDDGSRSRNALPPPQQLTVEMQLNKSFLVAWNAPGSGDDEECNKRYRTLVGEISSFQVIVDGTLHSSVLSNNETGLKALISGLDTNQGLHRISVKSVSKEGGKKPSQEAACTMVIGKEAPLGPTGIKSSRITSTSCTITWIPSNTNFLHSIRVNGVEVKTVKRGVYRHVLAGLSPNTKYKVTIRAKNIRQAAPAQIISCENLLDNLSSQIEIRTLPEGLPDPPLDVRVDAAEQPGQWCVSWLPVTINSSGTSNGALVIGYTVYCNGNRIKDVDSGTADHANVLQQNCGTCVTVRTKSTGDRFSKESHPFIIPSHLLFQTSDVDEEDDLEDVKQMQPVRELTLNYNGFSHDLDSDIGPSELSDIAEEPEEDEEDEDGSPRRKTSYSSSSLLAPSYERYKQSNSLSMWSKTVSNLSSSQFSANQLAFPPEKDKILNAKGINSPNNTTATTTSGLTTKINVSSTSDQLDNNNYTKNFLDKSSPSLKSGVSSRIRIFVALFDYDPSKMSPNPDASEEELPFREGQLIKIYGDKDPDGFYYGESNGKSGYVPCNMVSEVQVDDERVAEELFRDQSGRNTNQNNNSKKRDLEDRWGDIYEDSTVKKKLALYDYDPAELSPNVDSEVELKFRTGDIIEVFGDMDDDGFYLGEFEGKRGLVPSNFLTDVPRGYEPKKLFDKLANNISSSSVHVVNSEHYQQQQQPRILGQQRRW